MTPSERSFKKTGYLNSEFKLFHICDSPDREFELHYHDFYKVLIFLRGNVSYVVEGRQYDLQPEDVILVNAGEIHRPIIHDSSPYDRIIIYLSPVFFQSHRGEDYDLFHCFSQSASQHSNLLRFAADHSPVSNRQSLSSLYQALSASLQNQEYAASLYQKIKIIEYMILLNRMVLQNTESYSGIMTANPVIQTVMDYIKNHLQEELSIDAIAEHVFLNRSYLMHLFKSETGCTIGRYLTDKRLFAARNYIQNGMSVTDACYRSGFKNYASFYHAYKNKYQAAPTDQSGPFADHIHQTTQGCK